MLLLLNKEKYDIKIIFTLIFKRNQKRYELVHQRLGNTKYIWLDSFLKRYLVFHSLVTWWIFSFISSKTDSNLNITYELYLISIYLKT